MKRRTVIILLVLAGLATTYLLFGYVRTRAIHRFYLQVERLRDAVRQQPGLEDVEVVDDSTHPSGVFIFCKHKIPADAKARLDHLFHQYFPDRPMQVDDPGPLYPTETNP
jgi:hypothetical protein